MHFVGILKLLAFKNREGKEGREGGREKRKGGLVYYERVWKVYEWSWKRPWKIELDKLYFVAQKVLNPCIAFWGGTHFFMSFLKTLEVSLPQGGSS